MATTDTFPWESVSRVKDHQTMERLESSCDMGAYYAEKLAYRIVEADLNDTSFNTSEMSFLRKCLAEKESLASKREEKQILVGVSGATGAGKSTLLNALLDCQGLLSSSDSSASTATICEVGYNLEEDPDKAFRCDVFYRDEADVRSELDSFFRDLHARNELLDEGGDHMSEEDWNEAVKVADSNIQCVHDKILAIWGRTLQDLDGMSTDNLLRADDPSMDFIRLRRQTVYSHDMADFSDKIQRYLDSSQSEIDVARPWDSARAQKMSLWPLIKMVKLFVKADILRSNIVLVDLPGLSDVVGARAKLAEEYYGKLDVTMVVTPIVRGADEMTGVDLMSRNQALNMKMDGKFDHKSFCVVLSKADVTDWPEADRPSLQMVKKLNAEGNKLRAQMAKAKKEIKSLKKRKTKSKEKAKRVGLGGKIKEAQKALKTLRAAKKRHERDTRAKQGRACFNYRQARDKRQSARISKMLQQQHESLRTRSQGSLPAVFKVPRVFSVGSKAYWDLKSGGRVQPEGYPTTRYTGVPELRQWLKEVTIPIREKITVAALKEYQAFYNSLQTWSDNVFVVRLVKFSAEEFEENILNPMLDELQVLLKTESAKFEEDIRNCDPLLGYPVAIEKCQKELCDVVKSWARRYPGNKQRLQLLHAMTFAAIIRRNGGPFTSYAGNKITHYHWMEDLATLFNSQILGNWVKQLHEEIPKVVQRFRASTDKTWTEWQERLMVAISRNSPDLDGRHLAQQAAKLLVLKEEFKNSMSGTVDNFVAESPKVRSNLVDAISTLWQPGFAEADRVVGGKGVTKRKQEALSKFGRQHGVKVFQLPVASVKRKIDRGLDKLRPGFDSSLSRLLDNTRLQSLLFSRNIAACDEVHTVKMEKMEDGAAGETAREKLVAQLRAACLTWSDAWNGQDFENFEAAPDYSVPLKWCLEKKATKDSGPQSDKDSDSDSDSDSDDGDETEDLGATKTDEDVAMTVEDETGMDVNQKDVAMDSTEEEVVMAGREGDVAMVAKEEAVTVFDGDDTVRAIAEGDVLMFVKEKVVPSANREEVVATDREGDVIMADNEDVVTDVKEEHPGTAVKEEHTGTAITEEADAVQEWRWVFYYQQG